MNAVKLVLLTLVALVTVSCDAPPVRDAKPGDAITRAHFIEATTGKCIRITGGGESMYMRVVAPTECW